MGPEETIFLLEIISFNSQVNFYGYINIQSHLTYLLTKTKFRDK